MQVDGFHSVEICHLSIEGISMRGKTHNIHNSLDYTMFSVHCIYLKIIKTLKFVNMLSLQLEQQKKFI